MEIEVNPYKRTSSSGNIHDEVYPVIQFRGNQLSYNVENDIVRVYRELTSYSKSYIVREPNATNCANYPSSVPKFIRFRNMDLKTSWTEIGRPIIITGTTEGHTITITSPNFNHTVPCKNGATLIYDLVPGETYTWSESSTNRTGTIVTSGQIRMIKNNVYNFRDIGGWPCYDDNGNVIGHIKYGQVYRGMGIARTSPYGINYEEHPEVIEEFMNLGITDDIDLREYTGNYIVEDPWHALDPHYPTINGKKITYHQGEIPSYNFKTNTEKFTHDSSFDNQRRGYLNLISHLNIIAGEGKVSYVHCATGADRTGVFIAILMALLGCSLEDIAKEYELTAFNGLGHGVNIGYISSSGNIEGVASGKNIRNFLYSFNTSSTTTARSIVNAIVNWLKGYSRTSIDSMTWNEYINILKTKMIKYN